MIRFISVLLLLSVLINARAQKSVSDAQNEPIGDENSPKREPFENPDLEMCILLKIN